MTILPKKIAIFGRPGSGKSTFALALHRATGIPLYHLDKYFFVSHWIERDYDEFLTIQRSFLDQEQWIIDGNSTRSLDMRFARADLVLYFNYSKWLCLWRILKRLFDKSPDIDDRADQFPEVIRLKLIRYMWTFDQRVAGQIQNFNERYPHATFVEVKSDRDLRKIQQWLIHNDKKIKRSFWLG